ncbi:thiosulfate sulfurtransferase [Meredithblackwellia eburnea MCA 4105]
MSSKVGLVSPKQVSALLADQKTQPKTKVLDASWFMPNLKPPRSGWEEYKAKRIPGAAFFDVDIIAEKDERGLAHMLPGPERFADACSRLGIDRDSHVVVYDTHGVFSAPRTAFTFKAFGHPQVSILDGGLPRWIAEGHPVDTTFPIMPNLHALKDGEPAYFGPVQSLLMYDKRPRVESYFIADIEEHMPQYIGAELDEGFIKSYEQVVSNSEEDLVRPETAVVLDARPGGRFTGQDPEPRPGLSSGHIPHSFSLPFSTLLTAPSSTEPAYQQLKSPAELDEVLSNAMGKEEWEKVKKGERSVIATCGSGMTAAVIWLALQVAGKEGKVGLYDESWTGYASRPESKIEKS